jgi:hypothetical protein
MKPTSQNSTPSGISRKKTDNFRTLRIYLILGSVIILIVFAVYAQFLIQSAKREAEYVPRIFAQYIAYTDGYLRQAEKYSQMLGEITSKHFEAVQQPDYERAIGDYMFLEFTKKNPIPVIITDLDMEPQFWNQVGVPTDSTYADLSPNSQAKLSSLLRSMDRYKISVGDQVINYVYYARPISLQDFIRDLDYSIVVTDRHKIPLYWRNVSIPEVHSWAEVQSADKRKLQQRMARMSEVPLSSASGELGYIYFTAPKNLAKIRSLFILEISLALLIIGFSTYGLFLLHRTEKDTLWIGLAKETAHQFGTPITSLMGWLDLLREQHAETPGRQDMNRILDYMSTDVHQLRVISSRFGKVGSQTKLLPVELHKVLTEIVEYFLDRLPHLGSKMNIHLISKIEGLSVQLDTDLFKWALENLIKNCIDAMSGKGGNIVISAIHNDKNIYVHIRDEGKGIPRSQWTKIFEPGVSTKNRGWGLGLSLAKRIVEEYHHGHIRVLESTVGEGATFEIRLPFQHSQKEKS